MSNSQIVCRDATIVGEDPEMRTGQLIAAVGELGADLHGRGLWDASDAGLLEAVWQFGRNYHATVIARQSNGPSRYTKARETGLLMWEPTKGNSVAN